MRILVFSFFCIAMAGCMVGPDFRAPAAPPVKRFTESPLPSKTVTARSAKSSGEAQHFLAGRDVPNDWWTLFHSKPINALVCAGLAHSPNLQAAEAALRQAKATWAAQFGTLLLPTIDSHFSGERQQVSGLSVGAGQGTADATNIFTLYSASVSVSYVLDIWGGNRRALESYAAQVDYQQFQVEAAKLTLTSNIVTTTINIASIRAQIAATKAILRAQEAQLSIIKKQLKLGGASGVDLASQETQVAQTRATLPPLQQNLAVFHNALAALVGKVPCELHLPTFNLNDIQLPTALPITLPSTWVRQRPDIRAQEALLHTASAQIGVATANLLPQVTLSGNYGWDGTKLGHLFTPGNVIWNYGTAILQPIFRGGALLAERRAAIAAFDQAAALYRQTVLQAFQNVADTLEALKNDAEALRAQTQAEAAARKALSITERQYKMGGVSYLSLLIAQRQYQQTCINRIQAQAARLADTAALYQALGGGWWNNESVSYKSFSTITYRRFTR